MMGGLSYMTGPQGPAAARRHVGQRHHGRHVRRDRRARRAARARAHRPRPGDPERAVRELRVPVGAAHAAVPDDRRSRRRRCPRACRRGASTTCSRWPTASSSSSARSATSSSVTLCNVLERPDLAADPALRDQRAARRGAAGAAAAAGRHPASTIGSTSCRPSSKRPACPTRRSCGPSSCSTTRT